MCVCVSCLDYGLLGLKHNLHLYVQRLWTVKCCSTLCQCARSSSVLKTGKTHAIKILVKHNHKWTCFPTAKTLYSVQQIHTEGRPGACIQDSQIKKGSPEETSADGINGCSVHPNGRKKVRKNRWDWAQKASTAAETNVLSDWQPMLILLSWAADARNRIQEESLVVAPS